MARHNQRTGGTLPLDFQLARILDACCATVIGPTFDRLVADYAQTVPRLELAHAKKALAELDEARAACIAEIAELQNQSNKIPCRPLIINEGGR